jgi:hypothetical protein
MRPELLDPFRDAARLEAVERLVRDLYSELEWGKDVSEGLARLGEMVGAPVKYASLKGAFGSIGEETFARNLLVDREAIPRDLSEPEMIELLERIAAADGTEFQIEYWVECLEVNTGVERISDLIYWPGEYFGDGDNSRELSPREILETALATGQGRGPVRTPDTERLALWRAFLEQHPPGTPVSGPATNVVPFGVYVNLGVPFEAILHVRFMEPIGRRKAFPKDFPSVGDIVSAMVRNYVEPDDLGKGGLLWLTQDPGQIPRADG